MPATATVGSCHSQEPGNQFRCAPRVAGTQELEAFPSALRVSPDMSPNWEAEPGTGPGPDSPMRDAGVSAGCLSAASDY